MFYVSIASSSEGLAASAVLEAPKTRANELMCQLLPRLRACNISADEIAR